MSAKAKLGCIVTTIALFAAAAISFVVAGGLQVDIQRNAIYLENIRRSWIAAGSPGNPELGSYATFSNPGRQVLLNTNVYLVDGTTITSLFALRSENFDGKGFLVISRKGELIWVDATGPPKRIHLTDR